MFSLSDKIFSGPKYPKNMLSNSENRSAAPFLCFMFCVSLCFVELWRLVVSKMKPGVPMHSTSGRARYIHHMRINDVITNRVAAVISWSDSDKVAMIGSIPHYLDSVQGSTV